MLIHIGLGGDVFCRLVVGVEVVGGGWVAIELLRTWDLYYGGSTVVQKKWSKHPRRF